MTKQQAIKEVENSFPSIFTREDVITLLNKIEGSEIEFDKEVLTEKLRSAVENALNNLSSDDIVDISSCEFVIRNGNEIDIDSIGINTDTIVDEVMRDIESEVDEYIELQESRISA